jgi:hypothetical protein
MMMIVVGSFQWRCSIVVVFAVVVFGTTATGGIDFGHA